MPPEEGRRRWKKEPPPSPLGILDFREMSVLELIWVCSYLIKSTNFLIKPKKIKNLIWVKLIWVRKKKTNVARHVSVDVVIKISLFDTSDFSIHEITAGTKLTRH